MNESTTKLDIQFYDEVESTSNTLQNYLANNGKSPSAIAARHQTGGRGRRGNSWASPEGNLYISIAIPITWNVF